MKQALFDILAPVIPGCRLLDPCAGGGGIGLEALSRGASRAVLVDNSPAAVAAIRQNQALLGDGGGTLQVFQQDARVALAALADRGARFDVVYLDPPYQSELYEGLLEQLGTSGLLEPGAVVVAEHFHKRALPETIGGLVKTRSVKVGERRLTFFGRSR